MGSLRDVTLGEVIAAAARYRPVVVTVVVVLLALQLLPQADVADTRPTGFQPDSASAGAIGSTDAGSTVPVPVDAGQIVAAPTTDFSSPSPSSSSFEAAFPDPEPSGGAAEPGSFGATDEPTNTNTENDAPLDPRLRIAGKAWATRTAGTPLAAEGVPAGSLPVGTRVGQDDKLSFVRLDGTDETFRLVENPTGSRETSGPAAVRACQVTEANWVEAEAIAISEAPAYDPAKCVEGVRSEDGVWSFDLVSFPSPTDARGIALVPGEGAGLDFQVAFQTA